MTKELRRHCTDGEIAHSFSRRTVRMPTPRNNAESKFASRKNFFIIFVDAIFTNLLERLFTKVFDVIRANPWSSCLYRACNAD
jgi:hypothetical protein